MEIKNILPIGTVVKLKGGKQPVMIIGVMQNSPSEPGVRHDYISVPYPEGHMDSHLHIAFDHQDIEEVIFRGYEDLENIRDEFLKVLEVAIKLIDKKKEIELEEKDNG